VVNFDVPAVPDDYIHRVGRTGRAELTGDAFTFVAPDEEADLKEIERAIGKSLPRVTLPDFDYRARPQVKLEIPIAERIAAIRSRKAEERARARVKQQRRPGQQPGTQAPQHPRTAAPSHPRAATPSSGRFRPRQNARRRRP
jgi:ATP-dependent RNA helicase RhlE